MNKIPSASIDARTRKLLEAPLLRALLGMAAPNALVMITQAAVGLLEIYFIAKLGLDDLAGVSQVFPILALITAVSQGAVGGGIVSAVARSLGRGQLNEASDLAWYAVAIALVAGVATTAVLLPFGRTFYVAMGARGPSLAAAVNYSGFIFTGAILIWLFNGLMAVVRGTGNMILPVAVVCGGAVFLIPISPLLIFGIGDFPALGVEGGAAAILIYYAGGSVCFAAYIWGHRGVLHPSFLPRHLGLVPIWGILRVGGMSSLVGASTNITLAVITGFVGAHGVSAVAGYGAGARLEFLLVPLSYGIGGPAGVLVGTNIGAGRHARALRAAWASTILAAVATEVVGLAAATWPAFWLGQFSSDPVALATGINYLRTVGPFFGFFGAGFALYCAAQGTGLMGWPVTGAFVRSGIAVVGGYYAVTINDLFLAVGLGMAAFGCTGLPSLLCKNGYRPFLEKSIMTRDTKGLDS